MATYSDRRRSGLPRIPGGAPWPAGGVEAPATPPAEHAPAAIVEAAPGIDVPSAAAVAPAPALVSAEAAPSAAAPAAGGGVAVPLRRGLPRIAGGDPWPPAGSANVSAAPSPAERPGAVATETVAAPRPAAPDAAAPAEAPSAGEPSTSAPISSSAASVTAPAVLGVSEVPLRRGLPRVPGGESWPAAGFAPVLAVTEASAISADGATPAETAAPIDPALIEPEPGAAEPVAVESGALTAEPAMRAADAVTPTAPTRETIPVPSVESVKPAPATSAPTPEAAAKPVREPIMLGGRTLGGWIRLGVLGVLGAVVAAAIIVLAARGVTTLPGVPEFVKRYPGEYELPDFVDPGFPAWARWNHFLNFFLMVLIIRSGLLVRHQQKPPAFYTPKRGGKKVSIYLWLHTSLDVLWLVNGAVFVVLLFASGHWARIVPTSWEVFPNAASALLQYLTLEWPAEHGWVNYNSLQQIMYFLVVFIAAPLAAITGVRMSTWWPERAKTLNRIYPAPVARAIHFPTMLFFCLFILVHVFLVLSTGALRNLNHMFAGSDEVNWTGFWLFALGLLITAGAWVAARPLLLAPIAGVSGKVSNR